MDGGTDDKRMRLRYAGPCRVCGVELAAKAEAIYERTTKTVRCLSHDEGPRVEPAVAESVDLDVGEVVGSREPYGDSVDGGTDDKRMRLRYAGACRVCGIELPAKAEAIFERTTKTVRCVSHDVGPQVEPVVAAAVEPAVVEAVEPAVAKVVEPPVAEVVDSGTAGASARREFERRKAKREERIRAKNPRLGGLILAVTDEKQSTTAWDVGAVGEERLGKGLDRLASDTLRLLHDRRIPRSKANIDHLAVTANGIYVIDAKKYRGRPHLKIEGGLFRPRVERLMVGSRDCTKLVDGVLKQVDVVRGLLDDDVPVHGVLCFVEADWPLIGGTFTTRGVQTLWPKKLYPKLTAEGPIAAETVTDIHRQLAHALPPA
ncbi:nuclease-related domain-containing protein [Rhodococcus sp. (in: high G+C Gram-positive bacteria)]|uniref:nuclease-related domain-containing protein n=1 Tax=Rhodococcus sp. TaxID=1831 RepID=UPI0025810C48|nr:nuclease-related domain-containing protein [Rhodococcus sp. (in: high G+C Gram-positive bacteria)]